MGITPVQSTGTASSIRVEVAPVKSTGSGSCVHVEIAPVKFTGTGSPTENAVGRTLAMTDGWRP